VDIVARSSSGYIAKFALVLLFHGGKEYGISHPLPEKCYHENIAFALSTTTQWLKSSFARIAMSQELPSIDGVPVISHANRSDQADESSRRQDYRNEEGDEVDQEGEAIILQQKKRN